MSCIRLVILETRILFHAAVDRSLQSESDRKQIATSFSNVLRYVKDRHTEGIRLEECMLQVKNLTLTPIGKKSPASKAVG